MSKERQTVSIDEEVLEEVKDTEGNVSGVVNRLLREYVASAGDGPIGLEMKLRDIEQKLDQAMTERDRVNRRIERLRNQKTRVEEEIEDRQNVQKQRLEDAADALQNTPPDPTNPAVQNWAEKVGVPAQELLRRLNQIEA